MRKQEPPFCIQVELSHGCSLQCSFCGINAFQLKPMTDLHFMTVDTAYGLARQIRAAGWTSRIEFAMHGEPTLNPNFYGIVRTFRAALPKSSLMVTSNGTGFLRGAPMVNLLAAFDAGLNMIALDNYKHASIVPKIVDRLDPNALREAGVSWYHYPDNPLGNPNVRRKPTERVLSIVQDPSEATKGSHSILNAHTGYGDKPVFIERRCPIPFREFSVAWDGSVSVCCIDWLHEAEFGNVRDTPIDALWQHPVMNAYRQLLLRGKRVARPCYGCNERRFREGLLPDKLGKETLPEPDERTYRIINSALQHGPMTKPARRAWDNVYPILPDWLKRVWDDKWKEEA